jgi:hypothetical protein
MAENGRQKGSDALLLALAAGLTVRDAAALAGIGERTAARRMADPAFHRNVKAARAEMVSRGLGKLAEAATLAVDTLRSLLGAESESIKLGAARAILEIGSKLRESVELEERIATLEAAAEAKGSQ